MGKSGPSSPQKLRTKRETYGGLSGVMGGSPLKRVEVSVLE